MGFMSGFFGSASTSFAEETARQRQLAMEQQRIDINEMQLALANRTFDVGQLDTFYNNTMKLWPTMTSKERAGVVDSLQSLQTEYNVDALSAYTGLFQSAVRDGMTVDQAKAYLGNLVTQPIDPDNPYGAIPSWAVEHALKVLEISGDEAYDIIKGDVEDYLSKRAEDAGRIEEYFWANQALAVEQNQANVDATRAQADSIRADTVRTLQQIDITEEQRGLVLRQLELGVSLQEGELFAQNVANGFLEERLRAELDNILFSNQRIVNDNKLFDATFDSVVQEAAARAGIAESQARVLLATESMDIAIKQGQVDQIPLLLDKLRAETNNIDMSTRSILANTVITEASQAALIAHNHNTARISGSEANMAAIREGQYSEELAANLAATLTRVALTESQTVGQGIANDLAIATFDAEVARHAAQANITMSDARVAVATEVGRIQAIDLANVLTRANATSVELSNLFSEGTLEDRIATVAATRGLTESQARVAIATEGDTIEAAALALEATLAQIGMWQASTELTQEQKEQIGRAFIADLVSQGNPELLELFAEELLSPQFGDNWQEVSEQVIDAAKTAQTENSARHNTEIALRQAQTRVAETTADLNVSELEARNTATPLSREDVFKLVRDTMGYPAMRDIQSNITDLFTLESSAAIAETLVLQLQRGGTLSPENIANLEPLLKELGLTTNNPNQLYDLDPRAIAVAIANLEERARVQRDSIVRDIGVYAYNLESNGHSVIWADLGLDPNNPDHRDLWGQLESVFPSSYLPGQEFNLASREFFQNFDPEDVPGLLETAAIVGTRLASSTTIVDGRVTDLASINLIVDALKQEYDSRNGPGAWDSLDIFPDNMAIFKAMVEPEFDTYASVLDGVLGQADLLQAVGVDVNPQDKDSLSSAQRAIRDRISFIYTTPAGGRSYHERITQALQQQKSLGVRADTEGRSVADQDSVLIRDLVNNFFNGDDSFIINAGIAEPGNFLIGGVGNYRNVDLELLLELVGTVGVQLNDVSNAIYTLLVRY